MERHFKFLIKFFQLFSLNPNSWKIHSTVLLVLFLFCRIYCIIEVIITCLACSSVKLTYHHTRFSLSPSSCSPERIFIRLCTQNHSDATAKSCSCYQLFIMHIRLRHTSILNDVVLSLFFSFLIIVIVIPSEPEEGSLIRFWVTVAKKRRVESNLQKCCEAQIIFLWLRSASSCSN